MSENEIVIQGARQHNLKNISLTIPRNKLVVITGLSGSGKSSLAFDTIYAEGQRRYVESLSAYARQFLGQMDKPDVDYIGGLSPAISIDQKTTSRNPRSTVGTVTEIYDYLRLLFARIGVPHCPHCGKVIQRQSPQQIADKVLELPEGTKFMVLAPLVWGRKGEHKQVFNEVRRDGYVRVKVDGKIRTLDEDITLDKKKKHYISVVVDRLISRPTLAGRLSESLETALKLGEGTVEIEIIGGKTEVYSEKFACPDCNISLPEIEPRLFSFNAPYGACPDCMGLGMHMEFDVDLVIPNKDVPFEDGAIAAMSSNPKSYLGEVHPHTTAFEGIIPILKHRLKDAMSESQRLDYESFMTAIECHTCHGARLRPEVLGITVGGRNINEVCQMPVRECLKFFEELSLSDRDAFIAKEILKEIRARLSFLNNVGLDYLTLSRAAATLSGGEAQRIRLATQIGSGLVGVLYILDEPSIGLHQRDNDKLLSTLKHLRDLGNTLLVVEHDEDTMLAADQIIDIGPGAGENGGQVVAQGTAKEIMKVKGSVTGDYLSGRKKIPVPKVRRKGNGKKIIVKGARANNLKDIDVSIPLGTLTVVTGVSGSGKSTLVNDILYRGLAQKLKGARQRPLAHDRIMGVQYIDKIINIDQSPIGRTPRSNPATYTGTFDLIRALFATTNEAKVRGYKPGRFSFNVKGGRCEACHGDGMLKIEMNFLPDVYVPCEVCRGTRYNRDTLQVHYKGKNISDVLNMTVTEACDYFSNHQRILKKLQVLEDVGLGYIRLGQSATTLSGGEAQRIKLAAELSKTNTGRTLYILDEPTTGLHMADVHKLLQVLERLVDSGSTVVVIEHNLDVIKSADYLIDLGPEGGDRGGSIVAVGTPEELAAVPESYTGQYIKRILK